MGEPIGGDPSGWIQVGGLIGAVLGGAALIVRGSWGEGKTAISQTRAEATDVFIREQTANRETLKEMVALLTRLLSSHEEMVRLMRDQRDDEKFVARTSRMLAQMTELEQAASLRSTFRLKE